MRLHITRSFAISRLAAEPSARTLPGCLGLLALVLTAGAARGQGSVVTVPLVPPGQNSPGNHTPAAPAHAALSPATGLRLLDALEASLKQNPQLVIEQYNVDIQRGVLVTAAGQFDWILNESASQQRSHQPLTGAELGQYNIAGSGQPYIDSIITNLSTSTFSATKQFRDGITLSPSAQAVRTTDNVATQGGINQATIGLQIDLPLERNRGRQVVDAGEISAARLLDATRMDLSQQVSDTLATAAERYWSFVAADATVALYKASEDRAADLLSGTETMVAADRLPANDLNEARATLASRISSRVAAEQALLVARQQLVLIMGLPAEQILALPAPAQDIPGLVASSFNPAQLSQYLLEANTGRADVLAAQLRVDANQALQVAAANQLKPQLDVVGSTGYTGLREGTGVTNYPLSLVTGANGVNFSVGLNYSQAPAKDVARGRLISATATTRQSQVNLAETARTAATAVVVAFEGVRNAIVQLEKARQSVTYYQAALDGEREKYRLRLSSLVDVFTVEDRLTLVVIDEVNARLAYANALVQLRQATGTIVPAGVAVQQVDPQIFYELPFAP